MFKYYLWALAALTYSLTTAEPPVSSYLPPATGVPGPSSQYGPPGFGSGSNSLDSSSQGDFQKGGSNSFNRPGQFGSNQQKPQNSYGTPGDFGPSGSLSSEYGPPQGNQQGQIGFQGQQPGKQTQSRPSTNYGTPNDAFGSLSDSQAPGRAPSSRNSGGRPGSLGSQGFQQPESSYGPPNSNNPSFPAASGFRPSNQFSGSNNGRPGQLRNEGGLSQEYGPPNNDQSAGYDNQSPSSSFGSPQQGSQGGFGRGDFGQDPSNKQPSSSYGVPSSSNQRTGSQGGKSSQFQNEGNLDQSYGPPNQNQVQSGGFGGQSRKPSFGSTRQGLQGGLSQGSSNRPPSSSYGVPDEGATFGASGQGGRLGGGNSFGDQAENIPEKYQDGPSNFDGSEDSSEPAKYEFSYQVEDEESGANFGHSEQRDGDRTTGEYNVVLPDGRKQVVEYQADQRGYKPQIRYEGGASGTGQGGFGGPAGSSGRGSGSGSKGYPRGGPGQQGGQEQGGGYQSGGTADQQGGQGQRGGYQSGGPAGQQGGLGQGGGYQNGGPAGQQGGQGQGGGYPRGGPAGQQGGLGQGGGYQSGGPAGQQGGQGQGGGYPRGGPAGQQGGLGQGGGYQSGGPAGQQGGQGQGGGYQSGGPRGFGQFSQNPSNIIPPSPRGQSSLPQGQDSFSDQDRYQQDSNGNSGQEGYPRDKPQTPFGLGSGSRNPQGGRPSFNQGIDNNGGIDGYPRSESPEGNRGDTTGYPRGGPSGFNRNDNQEENQSPNAGFDQGGRGFGRSQSGNNENGYPRGGPAGFDPNSQGRGRGFSPSRQNGFGRNGAKGNSRGYPSGGPGDSANIGRQTGSDSQISEGYPSGGPSGRRGSGY